MDNQTIAIFIICGQQFDVVACWDNNTPENKFEFYDIYDKEGICLNEGMPFYNFPSWFELKEYLTENGYV